jgi:hypothetical protein
VIPKVFYKLREAEMGKEHHLAERRQAILRAIEKAGQLSVDDLRIKNNIDKFNF